ncbi:MAG: hypothetical protein O2780_08025 [Proteobacteria bacterium]|nr:hypothetical protein [Pseudomonadota bacterium]
MHDNVLFSIAFLSQILLVSVWLPAKVLAHARTILELCPPDQFPRLYPKPVAVYERSLVHFTWLNGVICLIGLSFWVIFNFDATNDDYAGIAWGIFMLQSVPFILLEVFTFRTWKLMRDADDRTRRSASLTPRRLTDVMSPLQMSVVAASFVAFSALVLTIDQFNFPWFGGLLNIVIMGGGYVTLWGIVMWNLHGRSRDPYMQEQDHINRVRRLVRQFLLVCVALAAYGMVTITLQALELHEYKQLAMSLYCQLLALGSFYTFYRAEDINYEVYRSGPTAANTIAS